MPNTALFSNNLLAGARNCAVDCGGVTEGTNVLILNLTNDPRCPVDEFTVHALATACQEVGARPQVLWGTGMEKEWWDDPSPIILGAFRGADLVINNAPSIGRPLRAVRDIMFREGVSMIRNMATTVEALSSAWARFPFELSDEITRTAGEYVDRASTWRVVAPGGTDISGSLAPPSNSQSGFGRYGTRRKTSRNRPFPQGCLVPITSVGANGVIVSDRTLPREARHLGVGEACFREPVRLTVQDNRVVDIEGGHEADVLRRFHESTAQHIGEDAWNLSSFHGGVNPKALLRASPHVDPDEWHKFKHNHPRVMHFHVGGSKQVQEYDYPYMFHVSLEVDLATLYLDGDPLYTAGGFTVLDDPRIRELAGRFGDPDDLLRIVELPPMPRGDLAVMGGTP
ncbi:MAG TPA: hypothetical protein VHV49_20345 [Pseudonocardiaceae bacterium]|nr:hypothetical protein [Pseudonocardiaceae bacterium]